jgi:hypothetical protein
MLFERKGFHVIAAPTDYEIHGVAEKGLSFESFLPGVDALARNTASIKEWGARAGCVVLGR